MEPERPKLLHGRQSGATLLELPNGLQGAARFFPGTLAGQEVEIEAPSKCSIGERIAAK